MEMGSVFIELQEWEVNLNWLFGGDLCELGTR
jgi:hypothetical protein